MKTVKYIVKCQWCNSKHELDILPDSWQAYKDGVLMQNAFPYLSADERELLISNTCGECYDSMFGES